MLTHLNARFRGPWRFILQNLNYQMDSCFRLCRPKAIKIVTVIINTLIELESSSLISLWDWMNISTQIRSFYTELGSLKTQILLQRSCHRTIMQNIWRLNEGTWPRHSKMYTKVETTLRPSLIRMQKSQVSPQIGRRVLDQSLMDLDEKANKRASRNVQHLSVIES